MGDTLGCRGQVFQKRAIVRIHRLTLLLHLLLDLYCASDERIDPSLDHLPMPLGLILEKLKERPEPPQRAPSENQLLDIHKRARKRVEAVVPERKGIKVLPEEEFGRGVDRESRKEVFEVERILTVGVEHDVDHFLGVLLE